MTNTLSLTFVKVKKYLTNKALLFAFLISLIATIGSLFYSEVAGFEPCKLCWFQRIFMYPQVLLLGLALFKKDKGVVDYSLGLSLVGLTIAVYYYTLQVRLQPSILCSAVGNSVDCSQKFGLDLGYATFPMMSLIAFALIAILMVMQKLSNEEMRS